MDRRHFVTGSLALASSAMSHAQNATSNNLIPKGPVRIIVGFPPGGGTDALARVLAQKLEAIWGVSILIDNRPGAAGVIAADYVSKQPPDGSVLLMGHINSHALAPALGAKLNYDADQDFTPLAMVGITPNVLICNTTQSAKNVSELVALCKRLPGQISFASAGGGSAQHFALEMFKLQAKIDAIHVPYKGSAPAITDLIGGQVNYCFETMTAATPHIKNGKLIALAQTRLKRAKSYAQLPTMAELGFPGFEATVWYGLMGPGKLNPAMAQKINDDINRIMGMDDVQEKMDLYGAEDGGGSIEKFTNFIKSEKQKWAQIALAAKIKIDG